MDENKEKDLIPEEEVELNEDELKLKQEMEELAKTFQEELEKAKAQEAEIAAEREENDEEPDILIQELEEHSNNQKENKAKDKEELKEDELCACCGEKKRGTKENPDSIYCVDCERGLRHYPFDFLNCVIAVVLIVLSLVACVSFAQRVDIFAAVGRADKLAKNKRLYSAATAYESALSTLKEEDINAETVSKRALINDLHTGNLSNIDAYRDAFKTWELKLPALRGAYKVFEFYDSFSLTYQKCNSIWAEDMNGVPEGGEIPYDKIIADIDALQNTNVEKTTEPVTDGDTSTTTTTMPNVVEVEKYSTVVLNYFKYAVAEYAGKDLDTQASFLENIRTEDKSLAWLYGPYLGNIYTKQGKDTAEITAEMRKLNKEDTSADLIDVISQRIKGDYDGVIQKAQGYIDENDTYAYEFARQQVLCYLVKGDYSKAFELFDGTVLYYSDSVDACNTYALCALLNNKESEYEDAVAMLTSNGLSIPQDIKDYQEGKVTVNEILTQGDYDVS